MRKPVTTIVRALDASRRRKARAQLVIEMAYVEHRLDAQEVEHNHESIHDRVEGCYRCELLAELGALCAAYEAL